MSAPERWSRVKALYHAARERDPRDRAAFLDAACGGEADLRRDVESMLAEPSGDAFLRMPAMALTDLGSDAATTLSPRGASRTPPDVGRGGRLSPGQTFGPYRIVQLLGRGGMGEVYEAEQLEHGRRVALKVLSQRLTDPPDRARFLREGQLAASINHPNSVYIFGSDEIDGAPVIAMELLRGGTLKDRVRGHGPLAPVDAADAIRQIIAGLDAAQAGGILHRDIKPANCFIDGDGTVKIGDFGLSISTVARDVTHLTRTGTLQGTPQFAAPEQLKGDPLDVRADIYAVGATLYYLLTGQPPFDGADLMSLLTRIATEIPRSPRLVQPEVPPGLATIVLNCLAKDRESRPPNYAVLDEALRPFGSGAPTPATIGLRLTAGVIDRAVLIPSQLIVARVAMSVSIAVGRGSADLPIWPVTVLPVAMTIAYYAIPETLWGASLGKWSTGLQVKTADGEPVGMIRTLGRAVVFLAPGILQAVSGLFLRQARPPAPGVQAAWLSLLSFVLFALLFSTARRRNGFAGLHELASGTRVVRRMELGARSAMETPRELTLTTCAPGHRCGPYDIVGALGPTDVGELLVGVDPSLRRRVWIHSVSPGTAALTPIFRDLSRPARLRWLSGRRSTSEAWDAYEAVDGAPLAALLGTPQPWRAVRYWLLDLAREFDAGLKDGSIAALTIDRVWITRGGSAKLLDFGAPLGRPASQEGPVSLESVQTFLGSIAQRALGRPSPDDAATAARARDPLPLSASSTLETLEQHGFTAMSEIVARISGLLQGPDRVERRRRAAHFCVLVPAIMALMISSLLPFNVQLLMTPNVRALNDALTRLSSLSQDGAGESAQERAALETYIAGRFRPMMVTDPYMFTDSLTGSVLEARRPLVERVTADHPNVSADDMAAATATLRFFIRAQERRQTLVLALFGAQLTLFALWGVWVFRGGLILRAVGFAVVTGDGRPASRWRALWRGLAGWGLIAAAIWLGAGVSAAAGVALAVLCLAGAAWAIVQPARGFPDRIAGTWLVPR